MVVDLDVEVILVPQGAEYRAVQAGLKRCWQSMSINPSSPEVLPIPVGAIALKPFLAQWLRNYPQPLPKRVLLMGVAGSLTSQLPVGSVAIYQACVGWASPTQVQSCDPDVTQALDQRLQPQGQMVTGLSSDRLIGSAQEKQRLGQDYGAAVVDMEGTATLAVLGNVKISVGMVRVISDDCCHDLPDVSRALNDAGELETWPLALGMVRSPIAAIRLIRGSLRALSVLENITATLFCPNSGEGYFKK